MVLCQVMSIRWRWVDCARAGLPGAGDVSAASEVAVPGERMPRLPAAHAEPGGGPQHRGGLGLLIGGVEGAVGQAEDDRHLVDGAELAMDVTAD
jgi:hypothetical protein